MLLQRAHASLGDHLASYTPSHYAEFPPATNPHTAHHHRSADRSADRAAKSAQSSGVIKLTILPYGIRLALRPWCSCADLKQRLRELTNVPVSWQRLFCDGVEVGAHARLLDLRNARECGRSRRALVLSLKAQNPSDFDRRYLLHPWAAASELSSPDGADDGALELVRGCLQGLHRGQAPQLLWDGTGGAYLFRDGWRNPCAVFKPSDEEPFAPNNPRGLPGRMGQPGIHPHIRSGEAHVREAIAHRLDHGRFAGVPLTLVVEAMHPAFYVHSVTPLSRYGTKMGSLAEWVPHDDSASNFGAATFPTLEVLKIALLDMRLLNTDRNDSNLLVRLEGSRAWCAARGLDPPDSDVDAPPRTRINDSLFESVSLDEAELAAELSEYDSGGLPPLGGLSGDEGGAKQRRCELVPIDHGGCLPSKPVVMWYNWCWLSWPQLRTRPERDLKEYIAALDPVEEARVLADFGVSPSAARASRCATLLIQRAVGAGLTLHDCALMLSRAEEEAPSELERLCERANTLVNNALLNPRNKQASLVSPRPARRAERDTEVGAPTPEEPTAETAQATTSRSAHKPILRRVSSEVVLSTSPPNDASAELKLNTPALENAFFLYFKRLLDEAVARKLARISPP